MSIMAQSGRLRSTPSSILCCMPLLFATYTLPPLVTQNCSSEPTEQYESCTGAAQCPGVSVRLGMAMQGRDLAAGGTVVKPTRRAPCHLKVSFSTFSRILSLTLSGRLLNTRPFLNVCAALSASRPPSLRRTLSPTAWQWKVRGPRQVRPHLCDVSDQRTKKDTVNYVAVQDSFAYGEFVNPCVWNTRAHCAHVRQAFNQTTTRLKLQQSVQTCLNYVWTIRRL